MGIFKMATLRRNRETFVFMSGDIFIASTKCDTVEIKIPDVEKEPKDDEKPQSKADDKCQVKNYILASAFSESGKYFAVGDNHKQLHVYKVSPRWELVSTRPVAARCTAITFPQSEKEVVVADRTGDVYKFSLIDTDASGELILGHLSLILDIAISGDDKYIITCDRDEKVRISHYPNAYNIQGYCLLHTEYVSQVLYLNEYDCLVSGSGDGTLASWTLDGENICHTSLIKHCRQKGQGDMDASDNSEVAMVTDNEGQGQRESEGQTAVEGQNVLPGVKKMIYCQDLNAIAVIYYGLKQLTFFSVKKYENGCVLTQDSHNALQEEPWDICFGDHHSLWILQHSEETPVLVYTCLKDSEGKIQLNEHIADVTLQQTQKLFCDKWSFFKASLDCPKLSMSLQKSLPHNNVQKYLEKKEERISAQKNKQQPPQKKIKTS